MNGPEHYREAERMVRLSKTDDGRLVRSDADADVIAIAQVHATLALAAATAMSGINHMDEDDFREWDKVAGVQPEGGE